MDTGMELLSAPSIISATVGGILAAIQMLARGRWSEWIGWLLLVVSSVMASLGTYCYFAGPKVVVTISADQRAELGRPYAYEALVDQDVYQGLYENGFVLWVDGRFFELGLDGRYWASFPDPVPTNDPRWFARSTLRAAFPQCGDRLPIGGVAKAMLGPQKQYYTWLGCLQGSNTASVGRKVTAQRFANGYVIEGILNPPQSSYRNRIVLINDGRWEQERMDMSGTFYPMNPN